ncbi:hypothetical protein ABIE49_004948 [Bradyrhizobium sp. OAE829]
MKRPRWMRRWWRKGRSIHTNGRFPPPLRGRVRERGGVIGTARVNPSPQPSPARGEGADLLRGSLLTNERMPATKRPDGQINSDLRNSCQAQKSKIFLFTRMTIRCIYSAIPSYSEGRRPSSRTLDGLRWTLVYASTMAWISVRQTVWSWRPLLASSCRRSVSGNGSDGVNQELVSGEITA